MVMNDKSTFGAEPEQLKKLLTAIGLGNSSADRQDDKSATSAKSTRNLIEQPGTRIGRYRLLRMLGEGGMGIVYLAEQQGSIRRRVALKVIKPGMDSARVLARFEAERQALALLDHLNIANVYDAGTTETGRPYFVMEYVQGLPITEYCDHHKLTIKDRLVLFQQVCNAVHHAHQKGIIHRDIKPSNILVSTQDDKAVPKIIDFGVAKAIAAPLTERTLLTEESQLLGTPEYMSPEQADMAGEDIDTRSDIYSLGVLLYVLLTGVLPFDSDTLRTGGIEHIRQIIRGTDPKTPSTRLSKLGEEAIKVAESRRTEVATLAKCLHRELEWIPLKAMSKERTERYRSATELADDIENYLMSVPLIAGPPSTVYKFKKFVRKNRALVSGITAVIVVLVLGIIVSTIFAIGQARARAEAVKAATEAKAIQDFLRVDVLGLARMIKGREATVIDVLNAAVTKLDKGKFQEQPLIEASIRATLGSIYWALGDYRASVLNRERAYSIYLKQLGEENKVTRNVMNWLAVSYNFAGRYREAEKLWDRLGGHKLNRACVYARQGRYKESEQLFLVMLKPAYWDPNNTKHGSMLLYSWDLAKVYREQGRYGEAEELFVKALNGQRRKFGDEVDERNKMMIRCMNELAVLYVILNRYDEAEELFNEGIKLGDNEMPGKDHPFKLRHVNSLGVLRTKQKRYEEAEVLFNQALAGRKLKLGDDHPETLETINDLGLLRRAQKHCQEAEKLIIEALEGRRAKLGPDHPHTLQSIHELSVLYKEQERYEEAEKLLIEAVKGRRLKLGDTHPHTIECIKNLITLYEAWNKPEEAEKWRAKLPQTEAAGQPEEQ